MAYSNLDVFNLMERWKVRMGVNPYSFQQFNDGTIDFSPAVWIQDERNELASVLDIELKNFNRWVGYNPYPIYGIEDVEINPDLDWWNQEFVLSDSSYLQEFGQLSKTSLGTESIVYSSNKATITFTTTELDSDETLVLYPPDYVENENYRIHDLTISYSGGDYTITGHKSLFVDPDKQLSIDQFIDGDYQQRNELDPTDNDNFLSTVAIYKHENSTTLQASLLTYTATSTSVATTNVTPIVLNSKEARFKLSQPSSGVTLNNIPYAVRVYYKAGYPLVNQRVFEPFETIIVRMARANLSTRIEQLVYRVSSQWKEDSKKFEDVQTHEQLRNPLGFRYIDYYTWLIYRNYHDKLYGEARYYV